MPAQLAHWSIAKDVAWRFITGKKDGYQLFQGDQIDQFEQISKYLYLGSSGPDLPYSRHANLIGGIIGWAGESEYADLFHYNKQGEFVLQQIGVAKRIVNVARQKRMIAFALGFTTHLVADSLIHPYVNCFAGIYHHQSVDDLHKICECHQDSYLAQKYFGRKSISVNSDDRDTWKKYIPPCIDIMGPSELDHVGDEPVIGVVPNETTEVFSDIVTACNNTYSKGPNLEYLRISYLNFYDLIIGRGYDYAMGPIPKYPHESLVQHERLNPSMIYFPDLRNKAVDASEEACKSAIELLNSSFSIDDQNRFRSSVKNWNMDTGYWIDVDVVNGKLNIIWRHRWC